MTNLEWELVQASEQWELSHQDDPNPITGALECRWVQGELFDDAEPDDPPISEPVPYLSAHGVDGYADLEWDCKQASELSPLWFWTEWYYPYALVGSDFWDARAIDESLHEREDENVS